MATRLFISENYDARNLDIIEIDEKEIEPTYSSYENFIKSDNGLSDWIFHQNDDGSFSVDEDYEDEIPTWLEKMINSAWDFTALTAAQKAAIIEASQYEIDRSEEADSSTIYEITFDPATGFSFVEGEPAQIGEHYTYWDGHNFKRIELTSDFYDTNYNEVTEEYPNWDDMQRIGENRGRSGGLVYFALKNEDESYTLIAKSWSAYQGVETTYQPIFGDDSLAALLDHCNVDDVKTYFIEYLNESIEYAKETLRKGETLTWDEDLTLVLTYRGEEHHFTTEQVTGDLRRSIKEAREAIRTRRIEAITEKLAANNYEGVLTLPLQKIFVEKADSIEAGNCEEYTNELIKEIREAEQIAGPFALRADRLLKYRNDNYSRRAILKAFRSGHYIHAKTA